MTGTRDSVSPWRATGLTINSMRPSLMAPPIVAASRGGQCAAESIVAIARAGDRMRARLRPAGGCVRVAGQRTRVLPYTGGSGGP
jgi:hypothetical protein